MQQPIMTAVQQKHCNIIVHYITVNTMCQEGKILIEVTYFLPLIFYTVISFTLQVTISYVLLFNLRKTQPIHETGRTHKP